MTPTAKLAYIEHIAATRPHTRVSSVFARMVALSKAEQLKPRKPSSLMTQDEIIAELRQLGAA